MSSRAVHGFALSLLLGVASPVLAETAPDVVAEIARLRSRLADTGAQQHQCLAGATQPVWTAALATDIKALQDRANQAAAEGSTADARRWKELAKKAEVLQAQVAERGRTGADLFQSQQIGLDCLDRHAEEREALRASLEIAVADPAAYAESLRLARESRGAVLRGDLTALREQSRVLSQGWKQDRSRSATEAARLRADLGSVRRRHTAELESEATRALADPTLRAAEALIAAAASWEREREAEARLDGAGDAAARLAALREREEAVRLARDYWATAERLLARATATEGPTPGTAWPGAGGTP
jgi:hypothetical protein